jgi:hypothetical protein
MILGRPTVPAEEVTEGDRSVERHVERMVRHPRSSAFALVTGEAPQPLAITSTGSPDGIRHVMCPRRAEYGSRRERCGWSRSNKIILKHDAGSSRRTTPRDVPRA